MDEQSTLEIGLPLTGSPPGKLLSSFYQKETKKEERELSSGRCLPWSKNLRKQALGEPSAGASVLRCAKVIFLIASRPLISQDR